MIRIINIINSLPFRNEINKFGGEIYAVGGIVRDTIMGVESDDLDIVIRNIEFDALMDILKKYGNVVDTSGYENEGDGLRGSIKFVSTEDSYNEYLIKNGIQKTIDIMLPRKECKDKKSKGHKGIISIVNHKFSIEDDLDRRDININAMAINQNGEIIDKNNRGQDDIKNKRIRVVNSDAFLDDPLRMLRIIRQSSKFGFEIDVDTIKLIKENASMLSDKDELPKERFLGEFKKMIGKSGLGGAVKNLVEFGMYESMFGIKPKIDDYDKFDIAHNVGEMAFMMFDREPLDTILSLIEKNITNDNYILDYARALIEFKSFEGEGKTHLERVVFIAKLYKISRDAMIESIYINPEYREIAKKIDSGILPKDDHGLAFKGEEFKDYVFSKICKEFGEFLPKRDGIKMGRAKQIVLHAIYDNSILNDKESIKKFLNNKVLQWIN